MAASTGDISTTLPASTTLATTLATSTSGLPPLTTVLSLPSSCLANYWLAYHTESSLSTSYEFLHLGPPDCDPSCFPSGYSPQTTYSAFYSPGLCPQSYIQACSTEATAGTVTETQATCCPSGYLCQTDTSWPWYSTNQCISTLFPISKFLLSSSVDGTTSSITTTVSNIMINAYGISIRYQSTDLVSATKTTYYCSSPPPMTTTAAPSTTFGSSTPEANHSSGLSSGGGAGIGVGATLGIFALIGSGLFYYFRRHRRSTTITYEPASVTTPTLPTPPPAPPSESHDRSELIGSQVYTEQELDHIPVIPREEVVSPVLPPSHSESVQVGSGKEIS